MASIPPELQRKEAALEAELRAAGRLIVAFSGGVDSSYLALAAQRALGAGALAVTADSPSYPASHRAMAELEIDRGLPLHELAANLRRAFSGIVAGNVKPEGIRRIREHGLFEIRGEPELMASLDELLTGFARDNRMKLPGGSAYQPCYRLVT